LRGGIVAYTEDIKAQVLGVDAKLIASRGAVSDDVAKAMAMQVSVLFKSTWALSTTGFAGPAGGTAEAPLGTVFIGLASPTKRLAMRHFYPDVSRQRVRELAALQALIWLEQDIRDRRPLS
jgi:PncC family amidohydrolase